MKKIAMGLLLLAAPVLVSPAVAADQKNILNMNAGAVVLSYSGEYDKSGWSAFNAFDGDTKSGWCSPAGSVTGTFVVELSQKYKLDGMAFDCRQVEERQKPGISAKGIEVWVSTTSEDSGFTKVSDVQVKKRDRTVVSFADKPEAQWLKLVVTGNWGNKKLVEINEIEAFGDTVGSAVNPSFTGKFSSSNGPMKLKQDGPLVTGCYPKSVGSIRGGAIGHVFRSEWQQKETKTNGTALMVMNSAGTILNGVWYADGKMQEQWLGKRDDSLACDCEPTESSIADRLEGGNRAILYGVFFDSDTAELKQESDVTLKELLSIMKKDPQIKILIEGHSDSSNTVEYNQALSKDRAQSVLKWLSAYNISEDRMTAKGLSDTKPVADNASAQGRALNRRVEISIMK